MTEFKDSDIEGDVAGAKPVVQQKLGTPLKAKMQTLSAKKRLHPSSGKVYESDKDSGSTGHNSSYGAGSSDGGYFDADGDSLSDDDDPFYDAAATPGCCACFGFGGSKKAEIKTDDGSEAKPDILLKP